MSLVITSRASMGQEGSFPVQPIPVGIKTSMKPFCNDKLDVRKNIILSMGVICDSVGPNSHLDSIQCDFEITIGFFVDDVLE